MERADMADGFLVIYIDVYQSTTVTPRYDPLAIPYLARLNVSDHSDFINSFMCQQINKYKRGRIAFSVMIDGAVAEAPKLRRVSEVETLTVDEHISYKTIPNSDYAYYYYDKAYVQHQDQV